MTHQEPEFLALADMDAWDDFWANNGEAIGMERADAFALACNQSLLVGGGAAPLFCVGFVD